jgi:hypothetical protein
VDAEDESMDRIVVLDIEATVAAVKTLLVECQSRDCTVGGQVALVAVVGRKGFGTVVAAFAVVLAVGNWSEQREESQRVF